MQLSYLGVDFTEGEKQENPEKNSRRTGETNYNKSSDTSSEHEAIASYIYIYIYTQVVTHPVIIPSYTGLNFWAQCKNQRANHTRYTCAAINEGIA